MTTIPDQDPARLGLRLALRLLPDVVASTARSQVYAGPSTPGGRDIIGHVRGLEPMQAWAVAAALANAAAAELPAMLRGHCTCGHGEGADGDEHGGERAWNWLQQRIDHFADHDEHPGEYWAARTIQAAMEETPRRIAEGLPDTAITAEVSARITEARAAGVDLAVVVESLAFALGLYLSHGGGPDAASLALLRMLADEPEERALQDAVGGVA
jgi:hypothetical protein